MIELSWVPLGLLLPMLIGAVSVVLLVRKKDAEASVLPPIGWALAIGLGTAAGMLAMLGFPPWKPVQAQHWVLIGVLPAAVVVGLINAVPKMPAVVQWLLRLGVVVVTVYVLMHSQLARWSTNEKLAWLGVTGGVMLAVWVLLHLYVRRTNTRLPDGDHGTTRLLVFALGATAGAIGGATIASGSITGGQLTASLAAAIGGGWLATLGRKLPPVSARGVVDVVFPPSFGLLVYGWYYAWQMQNPLSIHIVAGLLAVAPLGLWITTPRWVQARPNWLRTVLGLIAVFLLIFAALALAGYEANLRSQATGPSYY